MLKIENIAIEWILTGDDLEECDYLLSCDGYGSASIIGSDGVKWHCVQKHPGWEWLFVRLGVEPSQWRSANDLNEMLMVISNYSNED